LSNVKTYKKGDVIFNEGDKIDKILFVKQGQVSLCLVRPKGNVELALLPSGHVAGEGALFGQSTHNVTAIAVKESLIFEMPVAPMKAHADQANAFFQMLLKASVEKQKVLFADIKSLKAEKDKSPCPPEVTAKLFATLFYSAKAKGKPVGEFLEVPWPAMKSYAQRLFMEPPSRLENALLLLKKLGHVELEYGKDPEDLENEEEVLLSVKINELNVVESFFEFYQHYFFKGGKLDMLKADPVAIQLAERLLALTEGEEVDRKGSTNVDYTNIVEKFKKEYKFTLTNNSFGLLERKGLLVQRKTRDSGVTLSFDRNEFANTLINWKFLVEIEKWNSKGFVSLEEEVSPETTSSSNNCPDCKTPVTIDSKFCSQCGYKFGEAA